MHRSMLMAATVFAMLLGCAKDRDTPTSLRAARDARPTSAADEDQGDEPARAGLLGLVAITGGGHGRFRATRIPHPTVPGNFAIHVEARLRGALPNTTYLIQRAPDTFAPPGPPTGFEVATLTDGSCQRGLAIAPWTTLSPVPAAFVSWPSRLTTDAEGDGEVAFDFALPFPLPAFDVMFRVIESGTAPRSVLVTECITLLE